MGLRRAANNSQAIDSPCGCKGLIRPSEPHTPQRPTTKNLRSPPASQAANLTLDNSGMGSARYGELAVSPGWACPPDATVIVKRLSSPRLTRRVALPPEGYTFPLQAECDRRSYTLEGRTEAYVGACCGSCATPMPVHDPDAPDANGVTDRWYHRRDIWVIAHVAARTSPSFITGAEGGPHTREPSGCMRSHC